MKNIIIVHYDEIGLKGRNRDVFEFALINNIRAKITSSKLDGKVKKLYGRIAIELENLDVKNKIKFQDILSTTFGIAYYSFGVQTKQDIEKIEEKAVELIQKQNFETFRVTTKRSDKNFPLKSMEVSSRVGAVVVDKMNKKVKLKNSDLECFIEIINKKAFIYTEKISGAGGLPTGVGGKTIVLASGGIDSPVAAWYAQKRGLNTIFLHFHSYPYTTEASIDKVKELVNILNKFDPKSKLYMCPFGDLQKQILYSVPDKYRIIMYRRFMFRIAEKLAKQLKIKALVTGEAIGQVASQTLENMAAVEEVTKMPILRPLCGFDKKEIIEKAQEIGTFETSILPHEDCCTLFMPKSPETKARLDQVLEIESKLDVEKLVDEAFEKIEQ
jgi:tRNA uracil 4-sulfurtransferase